MMDWVFLTGMILSCVIGLVAGRLWALTRPETQEQLLERAKMTTYDFNTQIVCDIDNEQRIGVSGAVIDPLRGDQIHVMFYHAGAWLSLYLSPARAKLFARYLTAHAEIREETDPGMKPIDSPTETYKRLDKRV